MKILLKKIFTILFIMIPIIGNTQVFQVGQTPTQFRNAGNTAFEGIRDTIGIIPGVRDTTQSLEGKLSIESPLFMLDPNSETEHFMGFRNGGDSITLSTTKGSAIGTANRLVRDYSQAIGNGSIVDGYMSASIGTQTIVTSDDAVSMGNESVAGSRLYTTCTLGHDGNNYVEIRSLYGDQSDQFINAVDSTGFDYAQKVFWSYPYFWTNQRTRDYPSGVQPSGLVRLWCDSVVYDGTNTKVYYSDSITNSSDVWITGCALNDSKGTANFTAGRRNSTQYESAIALGSNNRSWGSYAVSMGYSTYAASLALSTGNNTEASGEGSASFNYKTKASGDYSFATGYQTDTDNRQGATTFGYQTKADNNYYINYNSATNFSEVGDIQGGFYTAKGSSTGAGSVAIILNTIPFNSAFSGTSKVVAVQTSNSTGRAGESAHYSYKWGVWLGTMNVIDSIDLTNDTIWYTGDSLRVDDKLNFNTYTDSTLSGSASVPGGLTYNTLSYVIASGSRESERYVKVSSSQGGASRNITSFDDTKYHTFAHVSINPESPPELISRTFADDGDVVGNGTTTGIRPYIYISLNRYRLQMYVYGLADRTIRWGNSTNYVKVEY